MVKKPLFSLDDVGRMMVAWGIGWIIITAMGYILRLGMPGELFLIVFLFTIFPYLLGYFPVRYLLPPLEKWLSKALSKEVTIIPHQKVILKELDASKLLSNKMPVDKQWHLTKALKFFTLIVEEMEEDSLTNYTISYAEALDMRNHFMDTSHLRICKKCGCYTSNMHVYCEQCEPKKFKEEKEHDDWLESETS